MDESPYRLEINSKGVSMLLSGLRVGFRKALVVIASATLVASAMVPGVAANAAGTYDSTTGSGTVDCSLSGYFTIASFNVASSSTDCSGTVSIPSSVVSIAASAFPSRPLTTLTFELNSSGSSAILAIGNSAFSFCNLTEVVIPASVTAIGTSAFADNDITSVILGAGLQTIGANAFLQNDISSVQFEVNQDGFSALTSVGTLAFAYNDITSLNFPATVTTIGDSAFSDNILSSLDFAGDSSLTTIGLSAFRNNILRSVSIPKKVTSIGDSAFAYNNLESLTFDAPAQLVTIGASAFADNDLGSLSIPESVTTIGASSFAYNNLTDVVVPAAVTSVGSDAFLGNLLAASNYGAQRTTSGSPSQTYIEGEGIIRCGSGGYFTITAFILVSAVDCSGSVYVPEGVTSIADYAFFGSRTGWRGLEPITVGTVPVGQDFGHSVTRVTFPSTLTSIGIGSFAYSSLTALSFPAGLASIRDGAFVRSFVSSVNLPNQLVSVGNYAFSRNQMLTSLTLGTSLTTVGDNAFFACRLTASLSLPQSLTTIGISSFKQNLLTSVSLPSALTSMGIGAFWKNDITTISIPGSLKVVPINAFRANSLTDIVIQEGVTTIGQQAFNDNRPSSISIPSTITLISPYAFSPAVNSLKAVSLLFRGNLPVGTDAVNGPYTHWGAFQKMTGVLALNANSTGFAATTTPLGAQNGIWSVSTGNWTDVVYDSTGGSAPPIQPAVLVLVETQIALGSAPDKDGYNFAGWSYGSAVFGAGATYTVGLAPVTFAAVWSPTVSYALNGGSSVIPTQTSLATGETFSVAVAPTRSGYYFTGWSDGSAVFGAGATYTVGLAPVTLTATWVAAAVDSPLILPPEVTPLPGPTPEPTPEPTPVPTPLPRPALMPKQIPVAQAVLRVSRTTGTPVLAGLAVANPIFFGVRSTKLDTVDMRILKKLVLTLPKTKGKLLLTGFVSSKAKATAAELKVATARAKSVAMALSKLGVSVDVGYTGFGTLNQVSQRATDRRVEIRWVATK